MSGTLSPVHPAIWSSWAGPRPAKLVIVGEAWGATEDELRRPFAGESGKELFRMLADAGAGEASWAELAEMMKYGDAWTNRRAAFLEESSIALTNVFPFRPVGNNIETLCGSKSEARGGGGLPPLKIGTYFLEEHLHHLERLSQELISAKPNLILCLGNVACWAVLRATNIGSIRGAVAEAALVPGAKVLATYHPAGVLRNWSWRPIVVADLMKALRQAEFPEIRRPRREVLVNPSFSEAMGHLARLRREGLPLACDTETAAGQITCISFSNSPAWAMTIPFVQMRRDAAGRTEPSWKNYWDTASEESTIWWGVKTLLEAGLPIVGQNFLYDLQYLLPLGISPRHCQHDPMLLHHSCFPEMLKGLGFLGSIYTDEASWKLMRRRRNAEISEKRDE